MAKHHLSRSAFERLQAEYHDLTTRGRIEVADKIEVPITMPASATFEGTAQQAGELAGTVVQEAMMDKIVQGVEATLALRLDDFAAMRGGGRVPARRRSK